MKRLTIGVLAHVDAGKTTLNESLLYVGGQLKKPGRVDHGDAFLDTDIQERRRGITIFSKQAVLNTPEAMFTLLDTPGHVDFSGEAERVLSVLDCAILVVSGTEGVQSHTVTLWQLLKRHGVPVFVFVNKMDLAGADRTKVLEELAARLGEGFVDFTRQQAERDEELALLEEAAMDEFLEQGMVSEKRIQRLIARRKAFPCYFGSALRQQGVEELLQGIGKYAKQPQWPSEFGARVFKISRDEQGKRLTHLKVTGGMLKVKDVVSGTGGNWEKQDPWKQKADGLRLYSGAKFTQINEAPAGTVCAVTGLDYTWPGQGLGFEDAAQQPVLQPVLTYQMILPEGADVQGVMAKLRILEQEDPQLKVKWDENLGEIYLHLMGEVQLEVLTELLRQRFGLEVKFGPGGILYKETITKPVVGIGHFEPLRHYAEVHLLMEPGEAGSGLVFRSRCDPDILPRNWQRLVLTHLGEKEHLGVLTGSPITDIKITLVAGRAHIKHTEAGDFREATYRAVRQGLMKAECQLLEPYYDFQLELPGESVGRAMTDIQRMNGSFEPPEVRGEMTLLKGSAPVAGLRLYAREVAAYTRGEGRLSCVSGGYYPCAEAAEIVEAAAYDPQADLPNTPDSVFCAHGAGFVVPWWQVDSLAHVQNNVCLEEPRPIVNRERREKRSEQSEDEELMAIFERTYGPIKRREIGESRSVKEYVPDNTPWEQIPEYLLVDGYNIIFAWDELKILAKENLDAAREALIRILANYQGFRKCQVILVFDAYKVAGSPGSVEQLDNLYVVYTKEAETADSYIEKVTYQLGKKRRVRVATSDGAEQLIILGHGTLRVSARMLHQEIEGAELEIRQIIEQNNMKRK